MVRRELMTQVPSHPSACSACIGETTPRWTSAGQRPSAEGGVRACVVGGDESFRDLAEDVKKAATMWPGEDLAQAQSIQGY